MGHPDKHSRLVSACLLSSFVPFLLAPLLWPLLDVLLTGTFSLSTATLTSLIGIALLALVSGMMASLLIGWPSLLMFEFFGLNRPPVLAGWGAGLSLAIYFAADSSGQPISSTWPLYVYVGIIGGTTGYIASERSKQP